MCAWQLRRECAPSGRVRACWLRSAQATQTDALRTRDDPIAPGGGAWWHALRLQQLWQALHAYCMHCVRATPAPAVSD
jgi:hypothetical protein